MFIFLHKIYSSFYTLLKGNNSYDSVYLLVHIKILVKSRSLESNQTKIKNENCRSGFIESVHKSKKGPCQELVKANKAHESKMVKDIYIDLHQWYQKHLFLQYVCNIRHLPHVAVKSENSDFRRP